MNGSAPPIGWIGLGAIGLPMATRAAAAGRRVWAYDPVAERCDAARKAGISIAADAADVGRRAGRLIACVVRSLSQADEALLGERGALRAAPGRLAVVMSSVGAAGMAELGARAGELGGRLVDAPILGNAASAAAGSVTLVVSGAAADVAEALPLLDELSGSVVDVGARLGAAQAMKMTSQLLQIVGMVATIEGMRLAERYDVARETALEVLDATAPASWTTRNWAYACDLWARRDPTTSLGLFAKDLAAAVADARAARLALPLTEEALDLIAERLDVPAGRGRVHIGHESTQHFP